jgi:two-component system, OmpR family, response regulator CpxR
MAGTTTDDSGAAVPILLADDDVELCGLMQEFFAQFGLRVDAEHDGRRALARALEGGHRLLILDVMMPGLDGFEVLRQLRKRSQMPVIMLTARTALEDRVVGLDAGADDYLPKPFGPEELLARIRAVLRRSDRIEAMPSAAFEVNGVRLNPATREAWCDGVPAELTAIEYDILEYLVRAAGRVVSRDELVGVLHQRDATPYDRSIDVHVHHLRRKLGDHRTVIRTVRSEGYLFCPE